MSRCAVSGVIPEGFGLLVFPERASAPPVGLSWRRERMERTDWEEAARLDGRIGGLEERLREDMGKTAARGHEAAIRARGAGGA